MPAGRNCKNQWSWHKSNNTAKLLHSQLAKTETEYARQIKDLQQEPTNADNVHDEAMTNHKQKIDAGRKELQVSSQSIELLRSQLAGAETELAVMNTALHQTHQELTDNKSLHSNTVVNNEQQRNARNK